MSLYRQLLITVVLAMSAMLVASVAVSTMVAKEYFVTQLEQKNIDAAQTLALTLSQMDKEPGIVELIVSAAFDTGHYEYIRLVDPDEKALISKHDNRPRATTGGPRLAGWLGMEAREGVAHVQDGWMQYGTIHVFSHRAIAERALWETLRQLFLWFVVLSAAIAIAGTVLIRRVVRPINTVIKQAEDIGKRRYLVYEPPSTLEFRRLVNAMNTMSIRVREQFTYERDRFDAYRHREMHDVLTGLSNRRMFMEYLRGVTGQESSAQKNVLVVVRLMEIGRINSQAGHQYANQILKQVAEALRTVNRDFGDKCSDSFLGRLNGRDFALIMTEFDDADAVCRNAHEEVDKIRCSFGPEDGHALASAALQFCSNAKLPDVLSHLDSNLAAAENGMPSCRASRHVDDIELFRCAKDWYAAIAGAIESGSMSSKSFYVYASDGKVVHVEAMVRLNLSGRERTADYFIHWARRLGLLADMELAHIRHLLRGMEQHGNDVAINVSRDFLQSNEHESALIHLLAEHRHVASRCLFEVAEGVLVAHSDMVASFFDNVRKYGAKVGIDHARMDVVTMGRIHEIALDYIKVDPVFTESILVSGHSQELYYSLAPMCHSLGIALIVQNVSNQEAMNMLWRCGVDAASGPLFAKAAGD